MTSSKSPDVDGGCSPPSSAISEGSYLEEEDQEPGGPPRLAPVSGVLSPTSKALIRPIAFKPVISPPSSGSLYISPLSFRPGPSPYSSSGSSGSYGLVRLMADDCSSLDSSLKHSADDFSYTPSPSEGVAADLEALLREKDSEIGHLRETLEHNEQVIFKVYQEKEQMWQVNIRSVTEQYEARLMSLQQRLSHTDHLLGLQRAQNEKEKLEFRSLLEATKKQRDNAESKADNLRVRLEDAEWTLNHRSGEVTMLRSQLDGDKSAKISELMCLRKELRDRDVQLNALRDQVSKLMEGLGISRDIRQINEDLTHTRRQLEVTREQIIAERRQWEEEKLKVIRYQKSLQMNYVHVCRRNRTLEKELQELAIELHEKSGESQC